jgi:toxin ParE1/3/4
MGESSVKLTRHAEQDIDEIVDYLIMNADIDTGLRFFDSVHSTFQTHSDSPGIARPFRSSRQSLSELKQWSVNGFENHLIFFKQINTGILIIRVLHGARDLDKLIEADTE